MIRESKSPGHEIEHVAPEENCLLEPASVTLVYELQLIQHHFFLDFTFH